MAKTAECTGRREQGRKGEKRKKKKKIKQATTGKRNGPPSRRWRDFSLLFRSLPPVVRLFQASGIAASNPLCWILDIVHNIAGDNKGAAARSQYRAQHTHSPFATLHHSPIIIFNLHHPPPSTVSCSTA